MYFFKNKTSLHPHLEMHWAIANLLHSRELSSVLCGVLEVWAEQGVARREAQKRGDICTHLADSLHCTAKTNTT